MFLHSKPVIKDSYVFPMFLELNPEKCRKLAKIGHFWGVWLGGSGRVWDPGEGVWGAC